MTIAVIILTGFLAGPAAAADDNSCWLEARQALYLSIFVSFLLFVVKRA